MRDSGITAFYLRLSDTGIRLGELANLEADDIDYEQNMFRVMGKGRRERFVPFGRRVAKTMLRKACPNPFWAAICLG